MKKIVLLLAVILLVGCSTDEGEKVTCCTIIDTGVSIKYVNEDGENLFEMDGGG